MKQFKNDELVNNDREIHVAAIKKVVPNFNDEGKSDDYVRGFYENTVLNNVSSPGKSQEEEPTSTENEDLQEEESFQEDGADEIAKYKQARLNMRGQ